MNHFPKALLALSLVWIAACGDNSELNLRSMAGGGSQESQDAGKAALVKGGNGAPGGQHFQLNIIGVPKNKSASMTSGNRIFLPLEGRAKVLLSEGPFAVIDANGTDGSAAFQLPAPDADGDGVTTYSVYARPVGKPGGSIKATTCATNPTTGEEVCSLETMVQTRSKGKSTFSNVSSQLLSISADIDGDGDLDRVPLFDSRLENFLWNFDNAGLKVLQLRFIEVPSTL